MIRCLLLIGGAVSVLGSVSIQMPYLNPAGVTYTGLHAPGITSDLHYVDGSSSVAYGNSAYFGRAFHHVPAPAIPTVHHVPAIAQVPVANVEARHAVIQNVVDVAQAKLATRKIEIRRPAIEKQFYDVEERVIVRPAGSAVVELDQPISQKQRGTTVIKQAVQSVASIQRTPTVGFRSFHPHHVHPVYPSVVHAGQYQLLHHAPLPIASIPTHSHVIVSQTEDVQQSQQQQEVQNESQFTQDISQAPQQTISQPPQQMFPQADSQEFDNSDSIAVDNPEIARARNGQQQQQRSQMDGPPPAGQISQAQMYEQIIASLQAQTQAQEAQLQRTQQIVQVQNQEIEESRKAIENFARSQPRQPGSNSQSQTEITQNKNTPQQLPQQRSSLQMNEKSINIADVRDAVISNIGRSGSSSPDVIPSTKISAEQSLSNQERLISLLTGRGRVIEVQGPSEAHQVRARVLSVTPPPDGTSPHEEKVNTRRIVVNRPIQTVEEVEVNQPFTNIQRVAVHSPAVLKTTHLGVAHVPTSIPVHGNTHAIHPSVAVAAF